jgi:hypothetical protein
MVALDLCEIENFITEKAFSCLMIGHNNDKCYLVGGVLIQKLGGFLGDERIFRIGI